MQKIFIGLLLLSLTRYSNGSVQSGSKLMYCIQVIKNKINTHRLRSDLHPRCKEYGAYSYGHPSIVKSWCKDDHYKIGKFCSIADNITFYLNGNHRTDWISTYPFMSFLNDFPEAKDINGHPATKGPIIIGNDVWIGSGVTILSGVTVGDGAVLGANSVVAKNVPPYAVVAGNPARVVKLRFTPNQITRLLTIRWWDWPIERIRQNSHLLCSVNIENFLNANDGH